MKRFYKIYFSTLLFFAVVVSCAPKDVRDVESFYDLIDSLPPIYPDYTDVTVPCNIAPLRFRYDSDVAYDALQAVFVAGQEKCVVAERGGEMAISTKDWKKLLEASDDIEVELQIRSGKWFIYKKFHVFVSPDSIDSYLAYRLIEPGYEVWDKMGIYQRCLESFDESPIVENSSTNTNCMNCHSFNQRDPDQMLFHFRTDYGGTYVVRNGSVEKLNTKTPETISALVYPYWHPSGRYVAFSTNQTKQMFHTTSPNRIEVFDLASDVVVYDVEKHEITSCALLKSPASFETFPTFSPDGGTLYFCTADSVKVPENYEDVHYSLCSIAFNPADCSFGEKVDTLVNCSDGHSVSFPRVSPDGRWLMYTLSDFGNFSIWHQEADLWMIDLTASPHTPYLATSLSSASVESYHSWSSNGRWVVFSSRREDGLYTRPYFAHFDGEGNFSKPFVLPQKDAEFYMRLMKSYNIPEFISSKVTTTGKALYDVAKTDAGINVTFSPLRSE